MKTLKSLVVPLVFAGWLLGGYAARGLTFFVTQTNDSIQEAGLNGGIIKKIKVRGGVITVTNLTSAVIPEPSLRGAILAANRHGGFNTILLRPKTYQLSLAGADEDHARTGDLDITRGSLTIMVVGKGNATINATGLGDRVFQVFTNAHLTLANLTIAGGTAPQAEFGSFYKYTRGAEAGGAIYNAGNLILDDCTITNNMSGNGNGNPGNAWGKPGADGGGIYNSGNLSMKNCLVLGNSCGGGVQSSYGGSGGGIINSGNCVLNHCIFRNNSSGLGDAALRNTASGDGGWGGNGGAVCNNGTMSLSNCLISDNSTGFGADGIVTGFYGPGGGGWGGNGAGIYNESRGILRVAFSTISKNSTGNGGYGDWAGAGGSGGAIYNAGKANLNTCTITGNSTGFGGAGGHMGYIRYTSNGRFGGSGGGICNSGNLSLQACTVVSNFTGAGGAGGTTFEWNGGAGGNGGDGGGICNESGGSVTNFSNTLIALNFTGSGGLGGLGDSFPSGLTNGDVGVEGVGFDIAGDLNSGGFNLISASDGSTGFTNGVNADQVGSLGSPIDPLIGPLRMNSGPTPTHALLPGSPAIDQGRSFGQKFDQRGHRRPHDYAALPNAPGGDGADIGAFERDQ